MTADWAKVVADRRTTTAAIAAMSRLVQSGVRDRDIRKTAWATTATVATFNPWTQPASATSTGPVTSANTTSATADGSVNPSHAASPPSIPAR